MQHILQVEQTFLLALRHFRHRDACPAGDNRRHVVLRHGQLHLRLALVPRFALLVDFGLQAAFLVAQAGGSFVVLMRDGFLLVRQHFLQRQLLLAHVRRRGVRLNAHARTRLVHQVNRLVGQIAVGNVAVRQGDGGFERLVGDVQLMVLFVPFAQTMQDGECLLGRRFTDMHRLEAALQRGILLDVLAVLVERRRADALQFAARQSGFQDIRRVERPFRRTRADDGVHFVNEQQYVARLLNLGQNVLEPFLELAAVLAARDHTADVQRHNALAHQHIRHIARNDALRQPLYHRALAHAGLANQHRIVLRAANQDLNQAGDFGVAADDGVKLVILGTAGEVAAVLRKGALVILAAGRGHLRHLLAVIAIAIAHRGERRCGCFRLALADARQQFFACFRCVHAPVRQQLRRLAVRICQNPQPHMLRADVQLPKTAALDDAAVQHPARARRHLHRPMPRMQTDLIVDLVKHLLHVFLLDMARHAFRRFAHVQQAIQEVQRAHIRLPLPCRAFLCRHQHLLCAFRKLSEYCHSHLSFSTKGRRQRLCLWTPAGALPLHPAREFLP